MFLTKQFDEEGVGWGDEEMRKTGFIYSSMFFGPGNRLLLLNKAKVTKKNCFSF